MHRFWPLFSQAVTVLLAIWFVFAALKPDWLQQGRNMLVAGAPSVSMREGPVSADRGAAPDSYSLAAQRAMPAVVNIFSSKSAPRKSSPQVSDPWFRFFFGDRLPEQQEPSSSLGSGVIVSPQGYILTNHHVVEGGDEIEVALADGRKAAAKVVGSDPESDLAVIKIGIENLPAITLGYIEQVSVGDVVLAIGNPFGVGQTVTLGIVSALGRSHLGINTFENFIQTDAAINPGNSGGALVDTHGQLLGINTAIFSRSGGSLGIGFAIPVSTVKQVMEEIIATGSVTRGWIGVGPQDITPELADSFSLGERSGVLITAVMRNGPADKAGMKPGDILVSVDGKPVADTTALLNAISQLKPGSESTIGVVRKKTQLNLKVIAGKRPKPKLQDVQD
ncbi:MAG: Do family serine endopeptidase [Candidatus Protistobacter heckmanni]|nr:Do family serine endopeptidase [Candidatus Protistobacter heckmanni]